MTTIAPWLIENADDGIALALLPLLAKDTTQESAFLAVIARAMKNSGAYTYIAQACGQLIEDNRIDTLRVVRQMLEPRKRGMGAEVFDAFHHAMWGWVFREQSITPPIALEALNLDRKRLMPYMPNLSHDLAVPNPTACLWWFEKDPGRVRRMMETKRALWSAMVVVMAQHYPSKVDALVEMFPRKDQDWVRSHALHLAAEQKSPALEYLADHTDNLDVWSARGPALTAMLKAPCLKERVTKSLLQKAPDALVFHPLVRDAQEHLPVLQGLGVPLEDFRFEDGKTWAHMLVQSGDQTALLWLASQYPDLLEVQSQGQSAYDVAPEFFSADFCALLDIHRAHTQAMTLDQATALSTGARKTARM